MLPFENKKDKGKRGRNRKEDESNAGIGEESGLGSSVK
jgi:hypothetical protein